MRYLGIDFGLRRVGLATSEGIFATPYEVIEGRSFNDLLEKILIEAKEFDKVVVGMPEGKMGQIARGLIKALRKNGINVEEAEETLSSQKALSQKIEIGIPRKKRKVNDDTAAAIILQEYLDNINK